MEIQIKIPKTEHLTKGLDDMQRRQVPFAVALATTRLAQRGRDGLRAAAQKIFQGGATPFTIRGIEYVPSRIERGRAVALVYIQDGWTADSRVNAAKFLAPEVQGGDRNQKGFEKRLASAGILPSGYSVVMGSGVPKDQYGNVRGGGGYYTTILSQLQAFTTAGFSANETTRSRAKAKRTLEVFALKAPHGKLPMGIYERMAGRTVRPLFVFVKGTPTYKKKLPWYEALQMLADQGFRQAFKEALAEALRTAR